MKKSFALLLAIAVCGGLTFGQDVQIKDQKAFFYAYLECTGPYAQMQVKIGEFMEAYFSQNLGPFTGLIALFLNAPGQVPEAELKWRIGIPIAKETQPAAPLQKDVFDHPQVAFALHVGPYDKIGETYAKISAFIDQNGWQISGPPMEMYLDNPEETPADKLRTEISIPVVKKYQSVERLSARCGNETVRVLKSRPPGREARMPISRADGRVFKRDHFNLQ